MGSSGEPGRCEHGKLYAEFCWDCVDRSAAMGSSGEVLSDRALRDATANIEWVIGIVEQYDAHGAEAASLGLTAILAEVGRLRAREAALASHINESLTDIAQSILESGGLPPELFPLDHARVTVASILKRLTQARALLASAEQEGGGDGA